MAALSCATAPQVTFASMDELKAHYKSDWHRYNLKRKVAGLPMVGRELFERVVSHAMAAAEGAERPANTSHLKANKPRPLRRAAGAESEEDEEDSEGEWEEVTGEEAVATAAALERRQARSQPRRAASPVDEDMEDKEEEDELDEGDRPDISLASNGAELIVNGRILGAREFARYYRQRPRPADSRQVVAGISAAAAGQREHALVLGRATDVPGFRAPAVTREQARIQQNEVRIAARMRMKVEISANGPQFRGFRDA